MGFLRTFSTFALIAHDNFIFIRRCFICLLCLYNLLCSPRNFVSLSLLTTPFTLPFSLPLSSPTLLNMCEIRCCCLQFLHFQPNNRPPTTCDVWRNFRCRSLQRRREKEGVGRGRWREEDSWKRGACREPVSLEICSRLLTIVV